ncbi:TRAP transporter substrate-binding protein [Desulfofustis glycolicus]|uniref:Tripartite ATP-independent transporter solute receptor, DctP family n=1 Tax=Desulfofustis glycolicus DSM 9705 TaxID=1121409 RepID=A0A1M5RYC3_9BACT|nr:TRAP transporter substrate-binding protein [Desulfofustis glycolicus]MCB2216315.1 TRAP transporter substrate-binding protein [Desulfobulbaceae bacterium]SHH31367.1 tripartite ATP-independent transporter solute receptor, DctP family [Desulfofustis glycolicus DSM 9705]
MKTNLFSLAIVAAMLLAISSAGSLQAATKLRIAGNFPVEHSSSLAMEVFKKELEEQSGGDMTVDVFPAMQLGGAAENVDQVRSGALLMTWLSIAYLSRTVPELEAVSLPFLFSDREQAFRVIDGKVGDLLNEKLKRKGFIALGYMELGARHVTNSKRPLKSLADFEGLKIRLQPNETHLNTFRALGANPVSMDIKEVYQALQQKVLDGQENPYAVSKTNNFNEVQQYLSDTGHFFDFIVVVANKSSFEAMSPEQQSILTSAMDKAIAWQRAKAIEADLASRDELIKRGMQFDSISPEVRAELQQATAHIVDDVSKKVGADLVDAVLSEIKQ